MPHPGDWSIAAGMLLAAMLFIVLPWLLGFM
jgi:hypothetical protein